MERNTAILLVGLLATISHLFGGWLWLIPCGALGGAMVESKGWLVGMAGATISWTGLVIWNYAVAPGPTVEMTRVVGALAGGLPGVAIVALTLLTAAALGLAGGLFGASLRSIRR